MQKAAIYVRDPLPAPGSIISKEDQENACREYCQARGLTVSATFRDMAGTRDEFTKMISEATRDDSTLDYIVFWKLNRFSMSLEGDHRAARQTQTSWHPPGLDHGERDRRLAVPPDFISQNPAIPRLQPGVPTAKLLSFLEAS